MISFIFIFLSVSHVEHPLICLLALHLAYFLTCLLVSLLTFLLGGFSLYGWFCRYFLKKCF